MKEDNNIEELFRSSFGEFEVTPPPAVKQGVDRAIAAAPWYRRSGWLWLLLLLPVAGIALFFLLNDGNGKAEGSPRTASAVVADSDSNSDSGASGGPSGKSGSNASASSASGKPEGDRNNRSASVQHNNAGSNDATQNTSQRNRSGASSAQKNRVSGKQRVSGGRGASDRPAGTNSGAGKSGSRSGVNPAGGQGQDDPSKSSASGNNKGGNNGKGSADTKGGNGTAQNDPLALNGGDQQGGNADPKGGQTDPPKQDPPKQDPPKEDPKNDPVKNDPPTDTVPKKWKPDSTVKESLPGHNSKKKKDDTDEKLWYASIYAGPQLSFNAKPPAGYTLDEKLSFRVSGEINRSLIGGYGLTTGLGHNSWSETFTFYSESYDSTYLYTDSVPIYGIPQFPDSITGYDYVDIYDTDTTVNSASQQTAVRTFFIPLYVSRHFEFGDTWGMLANAGAVFNFYKVTGDSANTKDFGMTVSGRVHATYRWKNWMFSAGVAGGWDMSMPATYAGYERKRYWITPQAGIHLRF